MLWNMSWFLIAKLRRYERWEWAIIIDSRYWKYIRTNFRFQKFIVILHLRKTFTNFFFAILLISIFLHKNNLHRLILLQLWHRISSVTSMDASTLLPIFGAHIIRVWRAFGQNRSRSKCFQVQLNYHMLICLVFFIKSKVYSIYSSQMIGSLCKVLNLNWLFSKWTGPFYNY